MRLQARAIWHINGSSGNIVNSCIAIIAASGRISAAKERSTKRTCLWRGIGQRLTSWSLLFLCLRATKKLFKERPIILYRGSCNNFATLLRRRPERLPNATIAIGQFKLRRPAWRNWRCNFSNHFGLSRFFRNLNGGYRRWSRDCRGNWGL